MTNLIHTFEKEQINKLTSIKRIPAFRAGDTIKVNVKIFEGDHSRIQSFEGICIARKNNGLNSSFTIRKISHGEGVERVFPLFSPIVDNIEIVRKGDVNRSKLYYLRNRRGKSARISDRDRGEEADQYELVEKVDKEETSQVSMESNSENNKEDKQELNNEKSQVNNVKKELSSEQNDSNKKKSEASSAKVEKSENETKS